MAALVTCPVRSCCSIISYTVPTYLLHYPRTLCAPYTVTPSRTAPCSSRPICSSPNLTPLARFLFDLPSSSSSCCCLSCVSCLSYSLLRFLLSLSLPSPVPTPTVSLVHSVPSSILLPPFLRRSLFYPFSFLLPFHSPVCLPPRLPAFLFPRLAFLSAFLLPQFPETPL